MTLTALILLGKALATLCGLVVFCRAVNVVRHMDVHNRSEHYLRWLAFGLSYATLAAAALGAVIAVWAQPIEFGHFAWLAASAGLIVFDRRPRRDRYSRPTAETTS